jgi:2,3-dihydroxybenzoate decarboxylase
VDYPYEDMTEANEWFKTLEYAPEVLQAIASGNARRILKLGDEPTK